MALDEYERERRKLMLKEARIPDRYNNISLGKLGSEGSVIRQYMKSSYVDDARIQIGAVFVKDKPSLAQAFARDATLSGASMYFYYLQTFATMQGSEEGMPQSYAIEWFEQSTESPFSSRERYEIETRIARLIDDGVIFYLFTSVHPDLSKWWSEQFITTLKDNCRIIEVRPNGDRKRGERASVFDNKKQGSKDTFVSKRVTVR